MKRIILISLLGISIISAETFTDKRTGLMWQDTSSSEMSYEEAEGYCTNLKLDGFKDWYLPTIDELKSIVDYTKRPALVKGFKHRDNNWYWTSTKRDSDSFWIVNFSNGNGNWYYDSGFVRCVRQ
jgi:hypothetical protein